MAPENLIERLGQAFEARHALELQNWEAREEYLYLNLESIATPRVWGELVLARFSPPLGKRDLEDLVGDFGKNISFAHDFALRIEREGMSPLYLQINAQETSPEVTLLSFSGTTAPPDVIKVIDDRLRTHMTQKEILGDADTYREVIRALRGLNEGVPAARATLEAVLEREQEEQKPLRKELTSIQDLILEWKIAHDAPHDQGSQA